MTHTRSQDQILLEDLKLGLPEAVEVWYKRYYSVVLRFISTKIDAKTDAEEIARDTFLSCLRHLPLFQGNSSLKTWMVRIASHEIADHYRRRYAKKFVHLLPMSNLLFAESPKNMHDTSSAVVDVLKKMREDYKEIILLKYVDHVSVKDMATKLDRSIKSIEADLFRARQEFRTLYALSQELANNS